jgi:hypothetical protein
MRVVCVPSTPALLPAYASREDPIAALREAVAAAIAWLPAGQVSVLTADASPAAKRVAATLLGDRTGLPYDPDDRGLLVVANGTATRTEKAPGHLDERAEEFDAGLRAGLAAGDPGVLAGTDVALGAELWCPDAPAFVGLGRTVVDGTVTSARIDYDDDPYGVQYWVARWQCRS